MQRSTRNRLAAALLVLLLVVLVVWYRKTRQASTQNSMLTQIAYSPATGAPPYLTFTFAQALDAAAVTGTSAVLKSFQVAASSPTPADAAASFIALLTQGPAPTGAQAQGPTPFVPTLAAPSVLTTNTLPAGATAFAQPMVITGTGTMQFVAPKTGR